MSGREPAEVVDHALVDASIVEPDGVRTPCAACRLAVRGAVGSASSSSAVSNSEAGVPASIGPLSP